LAEHHKNYLVSGGEHLGAVPERLLAAVEPIYPVSESTDLLFPSVYQSLLADHFRHCIARDPQDLRSHVRRILLAYERADGPELFAAMLDLFIALGRKGFNLRRRMLGVSRGGLEAHQYSLLRDSLPEGVDESKVTIAPGSLLCRGIEGSLNLVRHGSALSTEVRDPLIDAREYLEYSQIDEARSVLEDAISQTPLRQELHYELLAIYRSTRDRTNFAKMFQKISDIASPIPKEWQELAEFFRRSNV
jgi:hypothetical protein